MRGLISLVVVLATTIPFPTLVGASPIHHSPRSPRGHGNVHGNARRGGGALLPRQSGGSCTDGDWNCDGMKLQRCNYGSWIEIETCITGQACSSDFTANYVIGCYWTSDSSAVSPVPASQTVAVSSDVVASSNPLSASVFSASSAASTASVAANSAVTTGSASASIIGDGALASKPSSSVGSVSATSVKAVVASTGVVGTSVTGVVAGSSAAPSVVASSVIASSVAASSVVVSSVVASAAPSASASSSSGSNSTVTPGTFSAPHYVLYADQWLTQPPDPSTISAYNHFLLSFWEPTGPLDDAQAWTELDATTRTSVLNEYHAAGIALMVSAFGSTGTPTSSGNDPTQVAQELAAFVKEYDLDGVDVDYEDFTAFNGGTAEAWLITFQTELRSLLPSPYLISHAPVAPWFVASDYTNGGGGYAHVNQEVGSGIDFYNVQFYSQGASEYTDCTTLLTAAASPWQGSSLFEIANNQGVELNKLVIGKPVDSSAASNGYMDAGTLAGCVTQAKGQGWNAGLMVWEYRPSDPTEAQTFMSTARGSS